MAEHTPAEDGSLYAIGNRLMLRPKRRGNSVSMGGCIGEMQNADTAAELVHAANAHDDLLAALTKAADALSRAASVWRPDSDGRKEFETEAAEARAAIRKATGEDPAS